MLEIIMVILQVVAWIGVIGMLALLIVPIIPHLRLSVDGGEEKSENECEDPDAPIGI